MKPLVLNPKVADNCYMYDFDASDSRRWNEKAWHADMLTDIIDIIYSLTGRGVAVRARDVYAKLAETHDVSFQLATRIMSRSSVLVVENAAGSYVSIKPMLWDHNRWLKNAK